LFIVLAVVNVLCRLVLPKAIGSFLPSVIIKTWGIYLCLWIRTINPKATSIFWVGGSLFCEAILIFLSMLHERTTLVNLGILIYALLAFGTGIASIYIVRYELLKHYNEVEPVGLDLGPVITFFFSYIYFQYHLVDIAEAKRQQASTLTS
jgi:hypothetical protein